MPARVPNASGNWSDASNWLTASNTMTIHASTTLGISTTSRNTTLFTAPNTTNKCVGVALYLSTRTAATAITVALQENNVDVVSRTFNAADVPLNCEGWFFFPLTTPYQYTTTTALSYRFRVATDSATASTTLRADSSGSNLALIAIDDRTSAVASADTVYVLPHVGGGTKTITFDQNDSSQTCFYLEIGYNATLNFSTTMTTSMIIGNGSTSSPLGQITPGGTFTVGTTANPIPAAYTATLQFDGSSTSTTTVGANGFFIFSGTATGVPAATFSAVGDPSYNSRSRTMEGYATGWYATTLASTAAIGATTITLTDDLGLRAGGGDIISVSEHNLVATANANNGEVRTVSSYDATTKTVTFSPALTVAHNAGAIVNNLSRNVMIKSVSTARLGQIITAGTSVQPVPTMTLRHVLFESFQRVGNQNQQSAYTPFGFIDIVGCSWYNPSSISSLGFQQFYQGRIINCHTHKNTLANSFGTVSALETTRQIEIIGCSVTGTPSGASWMSGNGAVVKDCLIAAWSWGTFSYVRFSNCTSANCQYTLLSSSWCEMVNCTIHSVSTQTEGCSHCRFEGLKVTGNLNYILTTGNFNFFSNCEWVNAPFRILYINFFNQNSYYYRAASFQNCIIPSMPSFLSVYMGGQLRRYTAATVPQAVFPVPSGATVANRIESIFANTAYGITQWFYIPVPASTQNNTVTVPVYLNGWGASLPSNTELYLEMFVPGVKTPVTSTTTVTANDQWQYLTVSGVSTQQGYLAVRLLLRKYNATAVMYVDWPLGMSTTNLDWYEGRPNEYLTPLSTYTAGQDFKSLRIDGPGMQEFKIPVASRLTKVTIKARYDSAHGTTTKPRALILAQPNLGITQQTATMTAGADTWETLSLSFLPAQAGTVTLRMESRAAQPWGRAWFDTFLAE